MGQSCLGCQQAEGLQIAPVMYICRSCLTKEAGHDQFNVYTPIQDLEERPCNLLCGFTQELRVNLHTEMVAERKREDR